MSITIAQATQDAAAIASQALGGGPEYSTIVDAISPFLAVLAAAFAIALIATPIMRQLALANGIVDLPDARRKNHAAPVAYLGGIAIFAGWISGILSMRLGFTDHAAVFPASIALGAAVITFTGLVDDVYGIRARVKIGGQFIAAAALASQDVGTNIMQGAVTLVGLEPYIPTTVVYYMGALLIAFLVVGGCNSLNLIDGMDGLAAGVTAIAAIGFLIIAAIIAVRTDSQFNTTRIVMSLAILGAVLGFLPYNFRPASIFMGDAGSLLLGYLCIATLLLFGQSAGPQPLIPLTACLIVFALPITDSTLAIVRRKLTGRPIFAPDAMHLHHMLRRTGLGTIKSVLVLYGLAASFAAIGVTMVALDLRWRWSLLIFFLLYSVIVVAGFRYSIVLHNRELAKQRRAEQEAEATRIAEAAPINRPGPSAAELSELN